MKGLSARRRLTTSARRLGSVAATYALEHLGGQSHAYSSQEFKARYEPALWSGGGQALSSGAPVLTCAAVTWLTLVLAAPVALSRGRVPALTMAVYQAGAQVCHQRPERSFHLAGVQLPVCARCFGLYVAGAVGLVVASRARQRGALARAARILLALAAIPTGVDLAARVAGDRPGLERAADGDRRCRSAMLPRPVLIVRTLARPGDAL